MTNSNQHHSPIPPDVAAYLMQAAEAIAQEKGFKPTSPEDCRNWLEDNMTAIALSAQKQQAELLQKVFDQGHQNRLTAIMTSRVWRGIRLNNGHQTSQTEREYGNAIREALAQRQQL